MTRVFTFFAFLLTAISIHADPETAKRIPTAELVKQADEALRLAEWKRADELLTKIMAGDPKGTPIRIPAWRQELVFKQGWCALMLKDWKTAKTHFEASYKKHPNPQENRYHCLSLRGWAEAAVGAGDHEEAVKLYRRYLREASKVNWDNPFLGERRNKR